MSFMSNNYLKHPEFIYHFYFSQPGSLSLAAKAPATNPASMLTTDSTEQDWSIERRAASPLPPAPYLLIQGRQ